MTARRQARGGSVLRGLIVLALVGVIGFEGAKYLWPHLRHAVGGTLFGDAPGAGGPVVCRSGNVLAGVHNPGRLTLRSPCESAIGRVTFILHAPDGDIHVSLLPDRGYWHLLDRRNYTRQAGTLVVEIVPQDQASVPIPQLGAHVRVTGAYVTDNEYGWREIHPAWRITPVQ